ncbi:hypothetical protein FRC14_005944 [Serendipita sp. 396]|nr:hypothetical protein FRC14_005944 [Serendipita sp. 396]KAG8779800.1 hypothetical protein FRC15_009928 [Serendipita sp. 397]KAG8796865.1 hypothetical protein FRC16_009441 [Serendipita sp. 398]KAG8828477.1 hypothetical protein FRC19_003816 [Serendipita sp. 401]KAG8864724.1 hypothetical protein FRC20_010105 [Serendipita sp. 405]KAG9058120.1 hypothetical protein FS842_001304 [Serendipita sp. 407]
MHFFSSYSTAFFLIISLALFQTVVAGPVTHPTQSDVLITYTGVPANLHKNLALWAEAEVTRVEKLHGRDSIKDAAAGVMDKVFLSINLKDGQTLHMYTTSVNCLNTHADPTTCGPKDK